MFASLCTPAGPGYAIAAPAKVNLHLELLGKRPDGYHDLETLIVCVNLFDTLLIQPSRELHLTCDTPGIPTDGKNLVVKAAKALQAAAGTDAGAAIHLTKRIPHEAGLGGGSSDAAAALFALNQLWKLGLSDAELQTVAGTVGSDVPAFLAGSASWCTGRGEIVEPVEVPRMHLVIVKPAVGLSTAAVYGKVNLGTAGVSPWVPNTTHGLTPAVPILFNRLQAAAFALQPLVERVYDRLHECEPQGVLLSGSGSSVFAVARNSADAQRIAGCYAALCDPSDHVFAVETCR